MRAARAPTKLPRRNFAFAAALVVAALALVWGTRVHESSVMRNAAEAASQKAQALSDLADSEDARKRLEANLRDYERLSAEGFVGAPDRVSLIEALELAARPLTGVALRWEFQPARIVQAVNDPKGQHLADVSVVPMKVATEGVEEVEWLEFLRRLKSAPQGQVRVEACALDRVRIGAGLRDLPAVRAECELQWVHIVPVAPEGQAR